MRSMEPCLCGDPYCPNCGGGHEPTEEMCRTVEAFVDTVTTAHVYMDGETFIECRLCGEWDGHQDGCPMPAIAKWQNRKAS